MLVSVNYDWLMCCQNSSTAKQTLQNWVTQNDITPAAFAKATGYSYNHAYQLLRGQARVSEALVARLLLAFGQEIAKELATALCQESDTRSSNSPQSNADLALPAQNEDATRP